MLGDGIDERLKAIIRSAVAERDAVVIVNGARPRTLAVAEASGCHVLHFPEALALPFPHK